ncbi:hypothetical protein [Alteromonas facilis]|uniref:hypothetical protein n=1 Tax=Alteromonas facilis TaxID=2048004 RepID=UPI000C290DAC|nr:hypothetical protein [Alteromonas facilis]
MKTLFQIFLFASFSISQALANIAASDDEEVRYFTKIVGIISPFIDYTLVGEIDSSSTSALNHYKVSYDARGRVKTIAYFHGIHPSEDSYFYAHEVRYSYAKDIMSRRYFDMNGAPKAMWRHYYMGGDIHHEQFKQSQEHVELTLYSTAGEPVETGLNAYKFVKKEKDLAQFIQTQYDKNETPVVLTNYFPFETSLIVLDEKGYLNSIINLNPNTEKVENHAIAEFSHVAFDFDEFGNELGWTFLNTNGERVNRPSVIESPGYAEWTYEFEWKNRKIGTYHSFEMRYFEKDGKQYCPDNHVCVTRYETDSFGDYSAQSFHQVDGALVLNPDVGYAKVTIIRDGRGRRIESRYFGADGQLRTADVAVRRYEYKPDGSEIVVEYDANMNQILTNDPR